MREPLADKREERFLQGYNIYIYIIFTFIFGRFHHIDRRVLLLVFSSRHACWAVFAVVVVVTRVRVVFPKG